MRIIRAAIIFSFLLGASETEAARLKDLASIEGVRSHPLVGYGLVVGLQGSGDDLGVPFTQQSISSLLKRMGVVVPPSALRVRNVAAVMVTGNLPAYARVGQKIDVTVASIGSAKSLSGGLLVMTPLRGPDGQIYGSAQGTITTGGFDVRRNGSSVRKNHTAAATIPNGGSVERALGGDLTNTETLRLVLSTPDFTTAFRVAEAVIDALGDGTATAEDATSVNVKVPEAFKGKVVELLATLEAVEVLPDGRARVVVNERTGTVVLGRDVRIAPVAVAHSNLTLEVQTVTSVSQPPAFAQGETIAAEQSQVVATEDKTALTLIQEGGSLEDVVTALNALGATARDLISILQAIKAAGALNVELEVR